MLEIMALVVIFAVGALSIIPFGRSLSFENDVDEVFVGEIDEDRMDSAICRHPLAVNCFGAGSPAAPAFYLPILWSKEAANEPAHG